jgi:hypothetical protein
MQRLVVNMKMRLDTNRWLVGAAVVGLLLGTVQVVSAENPADDSYHQGEARRQDLIARQLDLNYRMIWSSGFGPRFPGVFEPWPRVPGDIWGYPGPRPIEHPIGHESAQTGPNRWTYRPIYAADVQPPAKSVQIKPTPQPAAPIAPNKVQLPAPSDANEPPQPNAAPRRAPRLF